MGVGTSPTVLVATAANLAAQDLFTTQKASLYVHQALLLGMGISLPSVTEFKLDMYEAARDSLIEGIEILQVIGTMLGHRFPIITTPVPQVPQGISAEKLVAKADRWAARAVEITNEVTARLDLAEIGVKKLGNDEIVSQIHAAKEILKLAIDQLLAGMKGIVPDSRVIPVEPVVAN